MAAKKQAADRYGSVWEVAITALRLGLTSFGGPVAHLGYFYEEYVKRKKWIDEKTYADLVALCQFLPGPASSQVGIGIGLMRAGVWGALAAWLGFTLPSAVALSLVAVWLQHHSWGDAGWMHGLLLAAVAVVAQAVWEMARKSAVGRLEATIAIIAAVAVLLVPGAWSQVAVIAAAGGHWRFWIAKKKRRPFLICGRHSAFYSPFHWCNAAFAVCCAACCAAACSRLGFFTTLGAV